MNKIIFISSLFFITQAYAHNEKIDLFKDNVCKKSLSTINYNSIKDYNTISHNMNVYEYKSNDEGYMYKCIFIDERTFVLNSQGWENMIPTGKIKIIKNNCAIIDIYDPAFSTIKEINSCEWVKN